MATSISGKEISRYLLASNRDSYNMRTIAVKTSYVLLHQIDLILTIYAVSLGLSELNPFIRYLLATPLQLVLIKFFIPVLLAWLLPPKILIPSAILLVLIIVWNIKELLIVLI